VGHNKKNANRGAAIARNATRSKELANRIGALEKEARAARMEQLHQRHRNATQNLAMLDRIEALERSTYAKARAWLKATYRRWRPEPPAYALAELEATTSSEPPAEPAVELEIVAPPVEAAAHSLDPKPALVKAVADVVNGLAGAELEAVGATLTELEPLTMGEIAQASEELAQASEKRAKARGDG
jgi:hypothetical protein